jgi:hypothetical protein
MPRLEGDFLFCWTAIVLTPKQSKILTLFYGKISTIDVQASNFKFFKLENGFLAVLDSSKTSPECFSASVTLGT